MSVPSAQQIDNLTYKYIQGIPYTSTNASTSTERAGSAFPKIASNNIMANAIPSTAPFISSPNTYPTTGFTVTSFATIPTITNPDGSTVTNVSGGIDYQPTGTFSYLAYYVNLPLKAVDSTNCAYWDASTNLTSTATISATNRLAGAIPSNYDPASSSYKIYVFKSDNSSNAIDPGGANGWYFDPNAGFLVFNSPQPNATVPTVTFWRYEGTYGLGTGSQWTTSGNNIFYNNGNVGIGINTPRSKLDVICNPSSNTNYNNMISGLRVGSGLDPFDGMFLFINPNGTDYNNAYPCIQSAIDTDLPGNTFYRSLGLNPFGGNVGIGTTNPTFVLDVSGTIRATGQISALSFNATSDYRFKNNVQPIDPNKTVDDLRPVEYDLSSGTHDMGFIAHEVQDIFPFLVNGEKDNETLQSLNYNGFIALLVKEIQLIKKRIKNLEDKIDNK